MNFIDRVRRQLEARRPALAQRLVGLDVDAIGAVLRETDEADRGAIIAEFNRAFSDEKGKSK